MLMWMPAASQAGGTGMGKDWSSTERASASGEVSAIPAEQPDASSDPNLKLRGQRKPHLMRLKTMLLKKETKQN